MTTPTIRSERIAYQIWGLFQRTGGDCTVHDMARVTGETAMRCRAIVMARKWGGRFRSVSDGAPPVAYRSLYDHDQTEAQRFAAERMERHDD